MKTRAARDSCPPPAGCSSAATARTWWRTTPRRGKPIWHSRIGATGNAPETYMLDGKQYVLATGGDQLFAFVLN